MKSWMRLFATLAAAGLAGCAVGPDYHTPATAMPGNYTPIAGAAKPANPQAVSATTDIAHWWQSFDDPELTSLINRAILDNPDAEIALARLQEARAQESVILGGALPEVDFDGAAGRGTGSDSTRGRVPSTLTSATNTTGYKEITHVIGFDAGWELDLFGLYRREIEAAHADTQAAAAARDAVLIALVSDVARAYFDARTLQLQLAIANDDVNTEQKTVNSLQTLYDRGITNALDLTLAKRELADVKSRVQPLQAAIAAAQRRVAVLLGKYPEDLAGDWAKESPIVLPATPDEIAPGLPVDLLQRRPDIRVAERQLAAANAQIGAATANLFPRIGVTAAVGFQGQDREPVESKSIWSAGPTAYWPLLDFGTLDAAIEVQDYHTQELLANYKKTVIGAVEEVDDAITNYRAQQDQLTQLGEALADSQRAVDLATQRYDRGITDFLNVLDAQRQLYDLQDQYATAQEAVVLQFIAIYKGLGGGWEDYQAVPPMRTPEPAILAGFTHLLSDNEPKK